MAAIALRSRPDRSAPTGRLAGPALLVKFGRGCQHGLDDRLVSGATAQIAGERLSDSLGVGRGIFR